MDTNEINNEINELEREEYKLTKKSEVMLALSKYNGEDRVIDSKKAVEDIRRDELQEKFSLDTNIPVLDSSIKGFREGQVVVLSAPTGQGKTSLAQTLTENFYENSEVNSLWFTYEVPVDDFVEKFSTIPLFYLPRKLKQNSLVWIEERIMEAKAKHDCKVVFIDHLHYLLEMQKMAEAKSLSLLIGMMLRELKRMAIEHKIIIFLISHMKKTVYDRMPEIEDLRDSSFIGQESDIVIFLKRYRDKEEYTNQATLKVAKNRRVGKLGVMKLIYTDNKFKEYKDETEEIYDRL